MLYNANIKCTLNYIAKIDPHWCETTRQNIVVDVDYVSGQCLSVWARADDSYTIIITL